MNVFVLVTTFYMLCLFYFLTIVRKIIIYNFNLKCLKKCLNVVFKDVNIKIQT